MNLKNALEELKKLDNTLDILEILGVEFGEKHSDSQYYKDKMKELPVGNYFISDLDGTFFRGALQKEAVSLFVKFVKKQNYLDMDLEQYTVFLHDLKYFDGLEKSAYNKEIPYHEYLNAGIYLLLKHKNLIEWDLFLIYIKNSFHDKQKINPYRFSFSKIKEVLESGGNFVFISGAPDFIFEIYLDLLKQYIISQIGESYANNIYGFGTHIDLDKNSVLPLWGADHKSNFIQTLKDNSIIKNTLGGMGDTCGDFGISHHLGKGEDFYFVNPDKKVIEKIDELKSENANYHLIIERKDLICEINKKDITLL